VYTKITSFDGEDMASTPTIITTGITLSQGHSVKLQNKQKLIRNIKNTHQNQCKSKNPIYTKGENTVFVHFGASFSFVNFRSGKVCREPSN
jgi:hypothetical protein